MRLELVGSIDAVVTAINNFPEDYHADYFAVRPVSLLWLQDEHPAAQSASKLAKETHRALRNWGAGKRKAPSLQSEFEMTQVFMDQQLRRAIAKFSLTAANGLGIESGFRRVRNGSHDPSDLKAFDHELLDVLGQLSRGIFVGNTNVTYPLKTLLLIAGLMPALDSKVRAGLGRAGFTGMDMTQFLLCDDQLSTAGRKLTRLPFVLGQCWVDFSRQFQNAIASSKFKNLKSEPARVFDILLFMQAKKESPLLLKLQPGQMCWYELH